MTCLNGFFTTLFPAESLAESLVRAPNGGAEYAQAKAGETFVIAPGNEKLFLEMTDPKPAKFAQGWSLDQVSIFNFAEDQMLAPFLETRPGRKKTEGRFFTDYTAEPEARSDRIVHRTRM